MDIELLKRELKKAHRATLAAQMKYLQESERREKWILRASEHLTQGEIADLIHISKQRVQQILGRKRRGK